MCKGHIVELKGQELNYRLGDKIDYRIPWQITRT